MITSAKRVIVDTNVLMAISAFGIDIFSVISSEFLFPHTVCVLSGTIVELEKIRDTQTGANKAGAKIALQILHKIIATGGVTVIDSVEHNVDDELVLLSQKGDIVLTQDRELKRRLVRPYLTIRQRKHLELVE